jgi:hypothetical protein
MCLVIRQRHGASAGWCECPFPPEAAAVRAVGKRFETSRSCPDGRLIRLTSREPASMRAIRLTYREPRIAELEPGAPDSLKKREPNFVMIASWGADKCVPTGRRRVARVEGRECREGPLAIQPRSVRAGPNRTSQNLPRRQGHTLDLPAQAEGAKADRTGAGSYPCRKRRSASRLSCSACLVTRAFVAR